MHTVRLGNRALKLALLSFLLFLTRGQNAHGQQPVQSVSFDISHDLPYEFEASVPSSGLINWSFSSDLDLVVELVSSSGWTISEDHKHAGFGERIVWESDGSETYSIRVMPFDSSAGSVTAEQYDSLLSNADSTKLAKFTLARGLRLRVEGRFLEAIPLLIRTVEVVTALYGPDHTEVAAVLNQAGIVYGESGDPASAVPYLERALAILEREKGSMHQDVGTAHNNIGLQLFQLGDYPQSEYHYGRALEITETALGEHHPETGTILNNLGLLHYTVGAYDQAVDELSRSIQIYENANGESDLTVAAPLANLGLALMALGEYPEAKTAFDRSLVIRENLLPADHPDIGTTLNNIAMVFDATGNYDESRALFERALSIHERSLGPMHPMVATTLGNLGHHLYTIGRYAEAQIIQERALSIRESVLGSSHADVATSLNNLAFVLQKLGEPEEAIDTWTRALEIYEHNFGSEHTLVATALDNIAVTHHDRGNLEEALSFSRRALEIREDIFVEDHPHVAWSLNNVAASLELLGRTGEAAPLFRRALQIRERILGPDHPDVATLLINFPGESVPEKMASLERAISIFERSGLYPDWLVTAYLMKAGMHYGLAEHDEAIRSLEEGIYQIENTRQSIGSSEDIKARYMANHTEVYDYMISWQLESEAIEDALTYAERGRSRVMLDQLAASQVDIRASVPPEILAPLEEREQASAQRITSIQKVIASVRDNADLSDEARISALEQFGDSLASAQQDYTDAYNRIKTASPLWRSYVTTGGEPVRLSEVQRSLVPERGSILYYHLGFQNSYLFLIPERGSSVSVFPLMITDEQAELLGVEPGFLITSDILSIVSRTKDDEMPGAGIVEDLATRGPLPRRGASSQSLLGPLFQVLMPEEAWNLIKDQEEVVIVPDGHLFQLPFEALQVSAGQYWLDAGPVIRYAPSLTVLHNIMRRPRARRVDETLSLSNPIFSLSELEGVTSGDENENPAQGNSVDRATRNSYERNGGNLARLPGTALESEAVNAAFGDRAATYLTLLSEQDATEENVRRHISGKRFVHLATHGLVDERSGSLFAALALTPSPSSSSLSDDGLLELHEIYDLELDDLELAVLSACETNVGTTIEAEGVFALNRGFLTAGARRVIASQWAVDDASTAQLIGDFFTSVVSEDQSGQQVDYSRALWDAKKALRESENWSDPYYWAPFILTGMK